MIRIIGLGGRKQSGKTVLSNILIEKFGYTRFTFDNELKNIVCHLLSIDRPSMEIMKNDGQKVNFSFKTEDIKYLSNLTKIDYNKILNEVSNKTYETIRNMLQMIGTNIIRQYNEDWHVNCVEANIKKLLEKEPNAKIVVDDVRFENEMNLIHKIGGQMFFLIKPDNWNISNHESEISLTWDMIPNEENIIINHISLEKLKESWIKFIETGVKNKDCAPIFNLKENFSFKGDKYAFHYTNSDDNYTCFIAGALVNNTNMFDPSDGVISFCSNKFVNDIMKEVIKCNESLYNPFIIENLKRWFCY